MFAQKNTTTLLTSNQAKLVLLFFLSVLIISSFLVIPYDDSFYYWDWGRHLALSYYDGSPAIAYLMRLFSIIFGNNTVAINFLGVTTIFLCLYFIYQTTKLFFDENIALNACLLWLLSTLVIHFLFLWVTYDNPMMIAWAMTIFFSARYIKNEQTVDLYLIGASVGLLLLSKYTGIVLIIALVAFIIYLPPYRKLFFNKHFYLSLLLALIISSPVFIWNYQHDWISFTYQLQHRGLSANWSNIQNYLDKVVSQWNILLFLPIYALFKAAPAKNGQQKTILIFLFFVSFTFFLFFLYQAINSYVTRHWLTPFTVSSVILCSYYFDKLRLRKLFLCTIAFYTVSTLSLLTIYSFFQKNYDKQVWAYELAKEAGNRHVRADTIIVTSQWESAAQMLFWLPAKPSIYTLPCGMENQYAFWSTELTQGIKEKRIKKVLYLDFIDNSQCISQFFSHCKALPSLTYQNKKSLFIYHCLA